MSGRRRECGATRLAYGGSFPRHARRFFTGAEVFEAREALAIGLLHEVAPEGQLDEQLDRTLHFWLKGGPVAQREAKQLAQRMAGFTPESAERTDTENAALIARMRVSAEGQEGLGAFLDKRAPGWIL